MTPSDGHSGIRRRVRRNAFTLAEVLVSIVVLGVGLVSVMRALSTCARRAGVAKGEETAAAFAARMMGETRTNPGLLLSGDYGSLGEEHPGFTWSRELSETRDPGVLAVRISVKWRTQGIEREFCLLSMVETAEF